jgi:hypothetical protein
MPWSLIRDAALQALASPSPSIPEGSGPTHGKELSRSADNSATDTTKWKLYIECVWAALAHSYRFIARKQAVLWREVFLFLEKKNELKNTYIRRQKYQSISHSFDTSPD